MVSFFLDLWSFHINSHLNLALKYESVPMGLLWGLRGRLCTVALMENSRADSQCWRDELRPWCEAARHRWSRGRPPSSDQACRRAQRSQRERATHEFLRASLLSSLLTNEQCHVLMRSERLLVGKQPWQMICWRDGTLCSKWWVRIIVHLHY